jgi:hypothetical protein
MAYNTFELATSVQIELGMNGMNKQWKEELNRQTVKSLMESYSLIRAAFSRPRSPGC